jgi:hypothetical protein
MYTLHVFYSKSGPLHHIEHAANAAEALARIPAILKEHEGCERIVVMHGDTRLFAVDCKGNMLPN